MRKNILLFTTITLIYASYELKCIKSRPSTISKTLSATLSNVAS